MGNKKNLYQFLVRRYENADFVTRLKAGFVVKLSLVVMLFIAIAAIYTAYVHLFGPHDGYSIRPSIMVTLFAAFLAACAGLALIVRGHFSVGGYVLPTVAAACIWIIMLFARSSPVERLDTIVFILVFISFTPAVVMRHGSAIIAFTLGNVAVFCAYIFFLGDRLGISRSTRVDYVFDSVMAMLGAGVVAYGMFSISRKALQRAEENIAERKEAELKLRESLEQSRQYFTQPLVGMATITPGMVWSEVNDRLCQMLGYSRAELAGTTWVKVAHADDLAADADLRARVISGETDGYEIDMRFVRKNGGIVWASVAMRCVRGDDGAIKHFVAVLNDITLRKMAEDELRNLAAIIETSTDFIGISNLDGRVTYMNDAGLRLTGIVSLEEARKYRIQDFLQPVDRDSFETRVLPRVLKGRGWTGEFMMRNISNDSYVPIEMDAFLVRNRDTDEPLVLASISRDITERKRTEEALRELATMDPLTGVFNRRHFHETAGKLFKQSLRYDMSLSAMMIDVDNFKLINDTYGHAVGDQTLTGIVGRIRSTLRESDVLSRYGGEEFVVLMPGTDLNGAVQVAERLCENIRAHPVHTERKDMNITVSVGVATLIELRDMALDDLVRCADEAMYMAKQAGKDCVKIYGEPADMKAE